MTNKVNRINHAATNTGRTITSKASAVMFPTSSKAVLSASAHVRNNKQLKLYRSAYGLQRVHALAFIALTAVLIAVFFVLPQMVTPPDPNTLVTPEIEATKVDAPPDSPWQDAQLAKQRREAQETLSKILALQEKLEDKKVDLWAGEQFKTAMETAATGDEQYRARNFEQAQKTYRNSLELFDELNQQIETVFNDQMSTGIASIEQNKPIEAIDSYQLATYLKPESIKAQEGLKRAQALELVMELVADGKHLMKTGQYLDAKEKFKQALALDSESKPAKQQLAKSKQAIKDESFASKMSNGFNAINQNQYQTAISAFNQALKIRPGAEDALTALEQAKNADIQARVSNHFNKAQSFEAQEKWQDAQGYYEKIQKIDSSVIKARIGAIRSKARAKLDGQLQYAINKPERMTNSGVLKQNRTLLADARKINKPGTRLSGQISKLNQLLSSLQQPVTVQIKSNNLTNITLYKVGSLGNFTAKNMDLKPGKYTLVGTREGFRDVRREFTIMPGKSLTTIIVQCEEKITNG